MQIHSTPKYFTIAYIRKRVVAWRHTLWRKEQRCPHAIYHARTIYNPTNNASPIKYKTKISPTIISHDDLSFNFANPQTPSQFARNFRWETLRWNILGVRLFFGRTHSARRYWLEDIQSEDIFINSFRLLFTYFINTTLLV